MLNEKPKPPIRSSGPNTCPVCGKSSYSAAGIHPQCAVQQVDDLRKAAIKKKEAGGETTKEKAGKNKVATGRWQKTCPQCKLAQHVRRKECDCGHKFNK